MQMYKELIKCNFRLCMVNYIILYKKFVEHHVIKLILLKISKLSARLTQAIIRDKYLSLMMAWVQRAESLDIFNKINLITWCSTNFLYKIELIKVNEKLKGYQLFRAHTSMEKMQPL